jgi:hypothetical protein
MAARYEVVVDQLTTHAGTVESVAGAVEGQTLSGGELSGEAFGFFLQFLPPALNAAAGAARDNVLKVATGLHEDANGVRQAARAYAEDDRTAGESYQRVLR